ERANALKVFAIVRVVYRIRLRDAHHAPVRYLLESRKAEECHFSLAPLYQMLSGRGPQRGAFVAEVFEAERRLVGCRYHIGTPVLEVLDPTDLDPGVVHIDPIVPKDLCTVDDEDHGQEVAIFEVVGRRHDVRRRRRVETFDELGGRHARDEIGAADDFLLTAGRDDHRIDPVPVPGDATHLAAEPDDAPAALNLIPDRGPHHAGAESRIVKLFDETLHRR